MLIRSIRINDAEKFLNMLKKLDRETKNMMFQPGERKTTVKDMKKKIEESLKSDSLILVAEKETEIIGYISIKRGFAERIKHSGYVVIGVLKNYWGKGIGSKLLVYGEKWARENKITRLELTVMTHNIKAIELYEKIGFKKEGVKIKSLIIDGEYIDEHYMSKIF